MRLSFRHRGSRVLFGWSFCRLFPAVLILSVGASETIAQCPEFAQVIEVSALADSGPGSFRQAIEDVNQAGGDATIRFLVAGVVTLLTDLPVLTASSVAVDGSSAPAPGLVVDGGGGVSNGLLVEGGDVCVRGLTFQNFLQDGLRIRGAGAQGNLVEEVVALDNGDDGLQVSEEATATLLANRSRRNGNKGLLVFAGASVVAESNNLIENGDGVTVSNGSFAVLYNNLIADNDDQGIGLISSSEAEIRGNLIVNNGLVGPNSEGIRMTKSSEAEITANVIRGSGDKGIVVMGKSHAEVIDNEIADNNGGGIVIVFSAVASVEGNLIEGNGEDGVRVAFNSQADLGGGGASSGGNVIRSNGGFEVLNQTASEISAVGNLWEDLTAAEIDAWEIFDDDEQEGLGEVDFVPRMGETDWDGDNSPDREDPCPHLAGLAPEPLLLRGTQVIRLVDSVGGRGIVRFKAALEEAAFSNEPDGEGGFYLTIRDRIGDEVAGVILPGGYPWVRNRGRNQWHYHVKGWQRVRSYLREVGQPGTGRYRVSVKYENVSITEFPISGPLQYSLEFVAPDTCYYAVAASCLSAFTPPSTHLCR